MIIFYAGAYSCEDSISFSDSGKTPRIAVTYKDRFMDQGNDISSCIPLYINEVPDIDQAFFGLGQYNNNIPETLTDVVGGTYNSSILSYFLFPSAPTFLKNSNTSSDLQLSRY